MKEKEQLKTDLSQQKSAATSFKNNSGNNEEDISTLKEQISSLKMKATNSEAVTTLERSLEETTVINSKRVSRPWRDLGLHLICVPVISREW